MNSWLNFVTSPAEAVGKYCDECVCLSAMISLEPHAQSLSHFLCVLPYVTGLVLLLHVDDRSHPYRREGGDGSAQRG